ncbi:hypothetical protein [Ornithinimicrobium sp. INDO-MA30-4]|uniref:hypothetical protein n=1 Tax=Ornithinimicrobium sp. INDO-MA30-4 TaxID=2908651 RepID=UPI001F1B00B0|nr:hypothetical protein [Ornithinimicrobium sp. INDO-MA30-4]UJH69866.1 hypothetical protein L0A91_11530 [Ornithinimicrobium sp. INDO-MA30-4]
MSSAETTALSAVYPPGFSAEQPTEWYEYLNVFDCRGNTTANPTSALCARAVTYCQTAMPNSSGPYSRVFRRHADADGSIGTWEYIGNTCFTDETPAQSGAAPGLTEAMIIEQFHRTEFALPTTTMQPPGNRTLINLPVYYQLAWPEAGFAPGEIDSTTLVGHQVDIRPRLDSATYFFGDGSTSGPTTSLGGPYPTGDITHTYTSSGAVNPHIEATYTGEVSVDGGAWQPIPATVSITGTAEDLQILTSTNRLYQD